MSGLRRRLRRTYRALMLRWLALTCVVALLARIARGRRQRRGD